jgi:lysozyme
MNQAGIDLLKNYEGFRENAYLDLVGVPTIGYGFTQGVRLGDHMTPEQGEFRLKAELSKFGLGLGVEGTENQVAAMTCLAYNIGLGNFGGSTVKRLHLKKEYQGAADAFRNWDKAGGKVVYGLVRRRESERELYLT